MENGEKGYVGDGRGRVETWAEEQRRLEREDRDETRRMLVEIDTDIVEGMKILEKKNALIEEHKAVEEDEWIGSGPSQVEDWIEHKTEQEAAEGSVESPVEVANVTMKETKIIMVGRAFHG